MCFLGSAGKDADHIENILQALKSDRKFCFIKVSVFTEDDRLLTFCFVYTRLAGDLRECFFEILIGTGIRKS